MYDTPLPGHFDGERIRLDVPVTLKPNTRLLITVLSDQDTSKAEWLRIATQGLDRAYGPDEPEYSSDSVRERNAEYEGR